MIASPCLNCPDRFPACHGSCERFKEYRKQFEEAQKKRKRVRDRDDLLRDGRYKGWKRYKRCGKPK